jgi:hypothetical protein
MQTTPLGKIFEIDSENPLHRNKSWKFTVKIRDLGENDPPFKILATPLFLGVLLGPSA